MVGKRIFSIGENDAARATFLDNAANEKVRVVVARSIDIDVLVSRYFPREWRNEKWCIGVQNLVERFFEEPFGRLWPFDGPRHGVNWESLDQRAEKVRKEQRMRQLSKRMVSGSVLHETKTFVWNRKLRTIALDGARLTHKREFDAGQYKCNFIVSTKYSKQERGGF